MKIAVSILSVGWVILCIGIGLGAWSHYYNWDRDASGFVVLIGLQGVIILIAGVIIFAAEMQNEEEEYQKRQREAWMKEKAA
jgi:hypothetical protein